MNGELVTVSFTLVRGLVAELVIIFVRRFATTGLAIVFILGVTALLNDGSELVGARE